MIQRTASFEGKEPSHQLGVDLFEGEWSSIIPTEYNIDTGGFAGAFEDERMRWAEAKLRGFKDQRILELGPLEGGHTYMLESFGAKEITAIEANPSAYLRCLVAKEILGLKRAKFLPGDFKEYIKKDDIIYDICIASGVLYHLLDPAETILSIGKICDKLFIWTHYYDESKIEIEPNLRTRFTEKTKHKMSGKTYIYHHFKYGSEKEHKAYCGGLSHGSNWMDETSLIEAIETANFRIIDIRKESNPNGPTIWIAAEKGCK